MTTESTDPPLHDPRNERRLTPAEALRRRYRNWRRRREILPQDIRNERLLYLEVITQAVSGAGAMSFIAVFLVRLGAPNWLVGLYTSLPALMTVVAIMPVGMWVQRKGEYVKTAVWGRMGFRAIVGSFALLPLLPPTIAPYVLVAARTLVSIPGAAVNVSVQSIWGKAIRPSRRPRMLSTRMAIHGIFAAAIGFFAGQWLDWAPYPLNYQLLFFSALLAGVASALVMRQVKMPEASVEEAPKQTARLGIKDMLPLIKSVPAFRNFSVAAFVYRVGIHLPMALFTIYRVRELGASDSWIGILLTVERVVSVVAYFTLSRLLRKPEFRRHLWIAGIGSSMYPLAMALVTRVELLVIPHFVVGIFGGAMNIFMQNTVLQVTPEDQRPTFVAANTMLGSLCAFFAPMLGTFLADATTLRLVFVVSFAIRLVGVLSFWRLGVGGSGGSGRSAPTWLRPLRMGGRRNGAA